MAENRAGKFSDKRKDARNQSEKRSRLAAEPSYVQHGDRKRKNPDYGSSDSLLLQAGLPFFNAGDKMMKEKFREHFEEIV